MYQVKIIDANAFELSDSQIAMEANNFKPDLIGIPLMSEILNQVYDLVNNLSLNHPEVKFVLGGPEVDARPQKVLKEFERVEFVLRGESEKAIVKLSRALEDNKKSFKEIPGLYFRKDGKIIWNDCKKPVFNLDDLKYSARHFLEEAYLKKKYYSILVRERPLDGISTSRGCPFQCRFCYNTNHKYRARSPESVLDELYRIYSTGIRYVRFYDDNFTLDRSRAMRIFDLIMKEKLGICLEIKSRADAVDEELLKRAKRAGVCQISYGMESGDQRLLDLMHKDITVEEIVSACELTKKADIRCHTSWLFGFPGETPETINKTIKLIIKLKPTTASLTILKPFPETDVYCKAKNDGSLIGDWNVQNSYVPWIKLPWMHSKVDLLKYLHLASRKIYFNPYYICLYSGMILKDVNCTMGRYAWQQTLRCGKQLFKTYMS